MEKLGLLANRMKKKNYEENFYNLVFIKLNIDFLGNHFNLVFCLLVQDIPGIIDGKTSDRGYSGISVMWLFILGLSCHLEYYYQLFFTMLFKNVKGSVSSIMTLILG